MIVSKKANDPVWTEVESYTHLPSSLSRLEEIAYNLWWVWTPKAQELFALISPKLWKETEGNPVELIRRLSHLEVKNLEGNQDLRSRLDEVYKDFQAYMAETPDMVRPSVAYFSMEYGLTNVLKIYSGGLGVLAGDYLKEASDSNVRLTAVGFLYRFGYFTQGLSPDGGQIANYEAQNFSHLPIEQVKDEEGAPLVISVPYPGYEVYAHVWRVRVGRIDLYLLDTDLDRNSEYDRSITHQLYGGDWENRLKQEYLLGIGGMLMLRRLGISTEVYHMNEGHAALMNAQRLVDYIEGEGMDFDLALELVRASSLYTVHTPVPAGHDYFDEGLASKYLGSLASRLGISWAEFMDMGREHPGSDEKFSMSTFALNTCQEANGVSLLHGKVSREMFAPVWKGFFASELHVGHVTNGVHLPTWASARWQEFYTKHLGADYIKHQTQESMWAKLQGVADEEIWAIRQAQKQDLVDYIHAHYSERWIKNSSTPDVVKSVLSGINPNALLIGFGRRFATYKRAHLLFTDLERLSRIVNNPDLPVQFFFTGKAHPADGGGQGLIKHILEISRRPEFVGKIIFLENYDMRLASKLIAGVDIWMNTPTRPLEASGTSGEKAEMNGVLNLSVLDGWWYEGYREGAGWALTDKRTFADQGLQDKLDATTIYDMFEREIIPLYYNRKEGRAYSSEWVQYIKNSLNFIAPHYTMRRMMDDYFARFYSKLAQRSVLLHASDSAKARELVEWKRQVAEHWDELEIVSIRDGEVSDGLDARPRKTDDKELVEVRLRKGGLEAELDVEIVVAKEQADGSLALVNVIALRKEGITDGVEVYSKEILQNRSGRYKVGVRILPKHELLPHRQDFAYVRWVELK